MGALVARGIFRSLWIPGVVLPTLVAAPESQTVTLESLLREMADLEARARIPEPTFTVAQASSYDRRTKTPIDPDGWFANTDTSQFLRAEEHGGRREWVLMDVSGPGAVVRFWTGGIVPRGRIRFYLDGAAAPALDEPLFDFFRGRTLVPAPFAVENAPVGPDNPGGLNLYLPIPYSKHCTITYEEPGKTRDAPPDGRWYNIEYRTYAPPVRVESFTPRALESARSLLEEVGRALNEWGRGPRGEAAELAETIAPGEAATLSLARGPSSMVLLEASVATEDPARVAQALRSTVLRAEFDGEETIWCPVGDFFGSGVGLNELLSLCRSVENSGRLRCRWVMPYERKATLSLANLSSSPVKVTLRATQAPWKWDARSMHFHSTWRQQYPLPTRPFSDWSYMQVEGCGVYLGDTLSVFNPVRDWWGEGDEKVYVDGEAFPSHLGTGSEDHYGYAWGSTRLFQGPFANQTRCDGPGNRGYTVVTRTRSLDAIPFTKSLRFDMEVWHWADTRVAYAVASYWYALPGATSNRAPQPEGAAAELLAIPGPRRIAGAVECETMKVLSSTPGLLMETQDGGLKAGEWSGGAQLLVRAKKTGDFLELRLPVAEAGPHKLTLHATRSWDYGILQVSVNGKQGAKDLDLYSKDAVLSDPIELGAFEPMDGAFVLRIEVSGSNPESRGTGAYFGLDCVAVAPGRKE